MFWLQISSKDLCSLNIEDVFDFFFERLSLSKVLAKKNKQRSRSLWVESNLKRLD